jgi:phenylalanine-4-hydroxylase
VIESFEDLLRQTLKTDFAPLYRELESVCDLASDAVIASDRVLHRGTGAYARSRAGTPAVTS